MPCTAMMKDCCTRLYDYRHNLNFCINLLCSFSEIEVRVIWRVKLGNGW